jgi:hypothetical protein
MLQESTITERDGQVPIHQAIQLMLSELDEIYLIKVPNLFQSLESAGTQLCECPDVCKTGLRHVSLKGTQNPYGPSSGYFVPGYELEG